MVTNEPNILLLSIGDAITAINNSPGIGWAFDELFAAQPKEKENSFLKWIDFEIHRLELDLEWIRENYNQVIKAPCKVSGVIVFDGCSKEIINSRVNYNANLEYRISHIEMANIEDIFKKRPTYLID